MLPLKKLKNNLLFLLYTAVLGAIVGVIIWTFLRLMNLGIELFWDFLPSQFSLPVYPLLICTLGGLLTGIWKRKFGDYPEELSVVLGSVKKTGRYKYSNVFSTIVSALLPLIIGASVGPEAGLTGIIAGLCTWVGDKLKRFRREVEELTEIGLSATLGTIFRSPMFGFMEPIEADEEAVLPKASKIVLYFAAILSSFGVFILLNRLFGIEVGIEGMEAESLSPLTYMYAIPLTIAGIAGGWLFFLFEKLTAALKNKFSKYTVLRATTGGVLLGIFGMLLPLTMFSGESQITQVTENMKAIGAGMLILIAVAKLLLTNICIESGLKGGHFFPVIFCGICIGCALSLVFNVSATLCAAAATTALVGHTLKKPIATVLLLMIIFPPGMIPIMLFSAIAARFIPTPKFLLSKNK